MNRPGFDSTRRNRNIGTVKSGHGRDNRLTIPSSWADDRFFYEKLKDPVEISFSVHAISLRCLVEPPLKGFKHACTIDDLIRVLRHIPPAHVSDISMLVLRQPKRKERILSSVWGRLVYWAEIGRFSGPAIFLEAQELAKPLRWSKSLSPDASEELDRLREDGHSIDSKGREHVITTTLDSVRNTQLYRTLPHEIGHYVDYLESVELPGRLSDEKRSILNDKYRKKTRQEKEVFAHRYAHEFNKRARTQKVLPFDRILDVEQMREKGMDPEWFV